MKTYKLTRILLVGLTALCTLAGAENEKKEKKRSDVSGFPFWTSQKRGHVPQFVPGLNAALQLTDAQRLQIATAQEEMMNDAAVRAARGISKNDPTATTEQRDKARAALEAAAARMHEKVASILTTEQKALITKVNAAYAAATEDTGIVYADKCASIKADEAARKRIQEEKNHDIEEQFLHKLDGILSAEQRDAVARAGEEEAQRMAKAAGVKKPVK